MTESPSTINHILSIPDVIIHIKYFLNEVANIGTRETDTVISLMLGNYFENYPVINEQQLDNVRKLLFYHNTAVRSNDTDAHVDDFLENINVTAEILNREMFHIVSPLLKPGYFFMYLNFMNQGIAVTMVRESVNDEELLSF